MAYSQSASSGTLPHFSQSFPEHSSLYQRQLSEHRQQHQHLFSPQQPQYLGPPPVQDHPPHHGRRVDMRFPSPPTPNFIMNHPHPQSTLSTASTLNNKSTPVVGGGAPTAAMVVASSRYSPLMTSTSTGTGTGTGMLTSSTSEEPSKVVHQFLQPSVPISSSSTLTLKRNRNSPPHHTSSWNHSSSQHLHPHHHQQEQHEQYAAHQQQQHVDRYISRLHRDHTPSARQRQESGSSIASLPSMASCLSSPASSTGGEDDDDLGVSRFDSPAPRHKKARTISGTSIVNDKESSSSDALVSIAARFNNTYRHEAYGIDYTTSSSNHHHHKDQDEHVGTKLGRSSSSRWAQEIEAAEVMCLFPDATTSSSRSTSPAAVDIILPPDSTLFSNSPRSISPEVIVHGPEEESATKLVMNPEEDAECKEALGVLVFATQLALEMEHKVVERSVVAASESMVATPGSSSSSSASTTTTTSPLVTPTMTTPASSSAIPVVTSTKPVVVPTITVVAPGRVPNRQAVVQQHKDILQSLERRKAARRAQELAIRGDGQEDDEYGPQESYDEYKPRTTFEAPNWLQAHLAMARAEAKAKLAAASSGTALRI